MLAPLIRLSVLPVGVLCLVLSLPSWAAGRKGSPCEETTDSPARPGRAFFKALARHQSMHRGSRSHAVKRAQGTNRTSTIACRPSLVTIKSEGRRRFKFLAQYIA